MGEIYGLMLGEDLISWIEPYSPFLHGINWKRVPLDVQHRNRLNEQNKIAKCRGRINSRGEEKVYHCEASIIRLEPMYDLMSIGIAWILATTSKSQISTGSHWQVLPPRPYTITEKVHRPSEAGGPL
jgi:hypothetical protein